MLWVMLKGDGKRRKHGFQQKIWSDMEEVSQACLARA
jgi:hypothetical protein